MGLTLWALDGRALWVQALMQKHWLSDQSQCSALVFAELVLLTLSADGHTLVK
jgi:hypothetical protein